MGESIVTFDVRWKDHGSCARDKEPQEEGCERGQSYVEWRAWEGTAERRRDHGEMCDDKEAQVWRDLHGIGGAATVHVKEIHGAIPVDMCSCGKSHGESNGRVSVVALSRSRSVTEKEKNH